MHLLVFQDVVNQVIRNFCMKRVTFFYRMHEHSKELSSRAVAYVSIDDLFGISASPMVKGAIELAAVGVPLDNSREPRDTLLDVWSDGKRELDMASTTLAFQARNMTLSGVKIKLVTYPIIFHSSDPTRHFVGQSRVEIDQQQLRRRHQRERLQGCV